MVSPQVATPSAACIVWMLPLPLSAAKCRLLEQSGVQVLVKCCHSTVRSIITARLMILTKTTLLIHLLCRIMEELPLHRMVSVAESFRNLRFCKNHATGSKWLLEAQASIRCWTIMASILKIRHRHSHLNRNNPSSVCTPTSVVNSTKISILVFKSIGKSALPNKYMIFVLHLTCSAVPQKAWPGCCSTPSSSLLVPCHVSA